MRAAQLIVAAALATALALPVSAQLLNHKDLSLATALAIATTAADTCKGSAYRVSVSVVDRDGEPIVQLRGDDARPIPSSSVNARPLLRARSASPRGRSRRGTNRIRPILPFTSPTRRPPRARCRSRSARR